MKKILAAAIALACATAAIAQSTTLRGSGNVITRDAGIKTFDAIRASGLFDLILTQGNTESVKVETDDNLQYLIEVSNVDDTLVIDEPKLHDNNLNFSFKDDEGKEKKQMHFKVYVTFKNINTMNLQVIGNVHNEGSLNFDDLKIKGQTVGNITLNLAAKNLKIKNNGVGNIHLSGTADHAEIANNGVGSFYGEGLIVQTMDIKNDGVGHAEVNVVKDIKVKDSFLGKVHNSGSAKTHNMDKEEI